MWSNMKSSLLPSILFLLILSLVNLVLIVKRLGAFNELRNAETYSYVGNDFPELLPLDRTLALVDRMFTNNTANFPIHGPDAEAAWNRVYPDGFGFVRLGAERRILCVSMFHQLHCVDKMRRALDNPDDPVATLPHLQHCMNYIRQMILCGSDLTLEPVESHAEKGTGVEVTHTCRDWTAVYDTVNDNYASWMAFDEVRGVPNVPSSSTENNSDSSFSSSSLKVIRMSCIASQFLLCGAWWTRPGWIRYKQRLHLALAVASILLAADHDHLEAMHAPSHTLRVHASHVNVVAFSLGSEWLHPGDLYSMLWPSLYAHSNLLHPGKCIQTVDLACRNSTLRSKQCYFVSHGGDNKLHVWARALALHSLGDIALRFFCRFLMLPLAFPEAGSSGSLSTESARSLTSLIHLWWGLLI